MRSSVLTLHIAAGIAALLSGTAAMVFRKGSERHRGYGNVFVVSMVALGISAAILAAAYTHETGNFIGGIFTVYMVGTAWATARRADGDAKMLDRIGCAAALVGGVLLLWMSVEGVRSGRVSAPTIAGFFLAGVAFLCAMGDMRMIRGKLSGSQRIARHLWRMCFAFFVATGSFFLGRIRIFPHAVRELYIPWILAFLPLILMIFWLVRVRMTRRLKMRPAAA